MINFQIQRYEGASTIYGPHTLTIHLRQYQKLVQAAIQVSKIAYDASTIREVHLQNYHGFNVENIIPG